MSAASLARGYNPCVRFAVLVLTASLSLAACSTTMTGRRQLTLIHEDRMDAMGIAAFASLKRSGELNRDPAINEYVQCVVVAILEVAPPENGPDDGRWEVLVFEDTTLFIANGYVVRKSKVVASTHIQVRCRKLFGATERFPPLYTEVTKMYVADGREEGQINQNGEKGCSEVKFHD